MAKATWQLPAWIKLDNAANIYPPTRTRGWAAMFRMSVTLTEPIDTQILQRAQQAALRRLPTFACRLRKGMFWYYFEHMDGAPAIQHDVGNPMVRMDLRENGRFLYRVRCYNNRIAVEYFHALTDGTGAMTFLLTMTAEYLRLRYGADIPQGGFIRDCSLPPLADEAEDSFRKHARRAASSRSEAAAYHMKGTPGSRLFVSITTGAIDKDGLKAKAAEQGVSVTVLMTAILLQCLLDIQKRDPSARKRAKPVKVSVPVNLRRWYGSTTVRNFASYINIGVNSAYGEYTFAEILNIVKHTMGLEITEKALNSRLSANVNAERNPLIRMMPLFIKSPVMRAAFLLQGDRYNTTTLSNLGEIRLPESMRPYVSRLEFLLGAPTQNPVVCACVAYGDSVYVNFSRRTREPILEQAFFTTLVKMGVHVRVESNRREI